MKLQTASSVISFARELEDDSAKLYQELAQRYPQNEDTFLAFVKENKKYVAQTERAYYGVISDALEGCFAFDLDSEKYAMEIVDVDIVCVQAPEAGFQSFAHEGGTDLAAIALFCRDDDLAPVHVLDSCTDQRFGLIRLRRVDKVDAGIQRLAYDGDGFSLALLCPLPDPAGATTAETHDTDIQTGAAKGNIVHEECFPSVKVVRMPGTLATTADAPRGG